MLTNEQFDSIKEQWEITNGHLASVALSLRELAQTVKERPASAPSNGGASDRLQGWRGHRIHFGKQHDKCLGEIGEKSLLWWIENYHPKPFFTQNGEERPPGQQDVALRKALDEAARAMGAGSTTAAERASAPPPPRPAPPPPASAPDEDVPF